MQLAIGKNDFARVLASVSKVVESRNTIQILSHVRLEADSGTLRVTGTDLDIVATDSAAADVSASGAICVDAKLLTGIVAKAAGDITLELAGGALKIKSGRSRFTLSTLPAEYFPDMLAGEFAAEFDIDLAALFAPCVHTVGNEQTRYYLCGVFFKGGEQSVAVSTDGHRLVRNYGPALPDFAGVIVPHKVVGLLPKGVAHIGVSDSKIRISAGSLTLVSKLIDGTFPDFERVIPTGNEYKFTVDREDFMKAVDRVTAIVTERGRAVKLALGEGAVKLTTHSDVGDAADEVPAAYECDPTEVGFNSVYLRDMLATLPDGEMQFQIDGGSPGVLTHAGVPNWLGVVMPMRI